MYMYPISAVQKYQSTALPRLFWGELYVLWINCTMGTDNRAGSIHNQCSVPELRNPGKATALEGMV